MNRLTSIYRLGLITISGARRLGPSTQFEDSVTFPIPSKGDYS